MLEHSSTQYIRLGIGGPTNLPCYVAIYQLEGFEITVENLSLIHI